MNIIWQLLFALLFILAELYPLNINEDGDMTVSSSLQIAALLVVGLQVTLIGLVIGGIVYGIIQKRPLIKTCFNTAQTIISSAVTYYVFTAVGGQAGLLTAHALIMPVAYMLPNTLLVSWILSLSQRLPLWLTWLELNKDTVAHSAILGIGGLTFAGLVLSYGWLGSLLVIVLIIFLRTILYQASLNLRTMQARFVQTVKVLMTALELRDPYTHGHSSRVAVWSRKIAQEMGLAPKEVEMIEMGGLMHDVGKVGVPDTILNKQGKLDSDEFELIKNHTTFGEQILLGMEGMETVAFMARQHHLYYNGDKRGYNDQIVGENIFIGSRILGVADAWDAMTTDRPYRKAISPGEAVRELIQNKGTQFDPKVVDVFIRVLQREGIISTEQTLRENFEKKRFIMLPPRQSDWVGFIFLDIPRDEQEIIMFKKLSKGKGKNNFL
jgi:HD-GYP domain-containing protein (c-di-GMP phosphodiesterase class II)